MHYSYWCMIYSITIITLSLLTKIPKIDQRAILPAWKIATIRALLPFNIVSPLSIFNIFNPHLNYIEHPLLHVNYSTGNAAISTPSLVIEKTNNFYYSFISNKLLTSMASILLIIYIASSFVRIALILKDSTVLQNQAFQLNPDLSYYVHCKNLKIYQSDRVTSPVSLNVGLFCCVILPRRFIITDSNIGVIEHELFHIKNKDTFWKFLSFLVVCIHWPNPIMWLFYYRFNIAVELVCDESVLKNHSAAYRKDYAKLLVDYATLEKRMNNVLLTPFKSFGKIKERIICIAKYQEHKTIIRILYCLIIVFICTSLVTNSYAMNRRTPIIPEPCAKMQDVKINQILPDVSPTFIFNSRKASMNGNIIGAHDILPNDNVIYDNNGGYWHFENGDTISIVLLIHNRHFNTGQSIEIGFVDNGVHRPLLNEQIFSGAKVNIQISKKSDYLFYIKGLSSDTIMVESLQILI